MCGEGELEHLLPILTLQLTPPPMGGQKATPSPDFILLLTFPFYSQLCAVTFLVHTVLPLFPMITEIMKFAPRLLKKESFSLPVTHRRCWDAHKVSGETNCLNIVYCGCEA